MNGDTLFDIDINQFIKNNLKKNFGLIALTKNINYKENKKININL